MHIIVYYFILLYIIWYLQPIERQPPHGYNDDEEKEEYEINKIKHSKFYNRVEPQEIIKKIDKNFLPDPPNNFILPKKIEISTNENKNEIVNENEIIQKKIQKHEKEKYYCDEDDDDGDEERKEEVEKIISAAVIQSTDLVAVHGTSNNGKILKLFHIIVTIIIIITVVFYRNYY